MAVAHSSKKEALELEEEFYKKGQVRRGPKGTVRPCLFDKYRRGEVEPRRSVGKNGAASIVERVEQCYPGTAKWLELPLWKALDFERASMAEIREVYEGLPVGIRKYFISTQKISTGGFWRKPVDPKDVSAALGSTVTIAALTASLNMAREGLLSQNQLMHCCGLRATEEILEKMRGNGSYREWQNVVRLMQNYIAQHRREIKYSLDGERVVSNLIIE